MTRAGKIFAKKTKAVPPSDMFFAAAIIMTYDALFNKPKHQNDPYNSSKGGRELAVCEEVIEKEDCGVVRNKPSFPSPPDSVSVSSTTSSSS
mmetsp:Transcript_49129/g.119034  ORF Transcript_49129/g.119034 Transcript_49129/m.119034 type:complete len:92 (-) Transcript_49129:361-636(-)